MLITLHVKTHAQAPNFDWAFGFGTTNNELIDAAAVDDSGNVMILGVFKNTMDFDPGPGVFSMTSGNSGGDPDMFVAKYDPQGALLWARQFGTDEVVYPHKIKTDHLGNIYVTGRWEGIMDFDPGPGTFSINNWFSDPDIYVLKLTPQGNFLWVRRIGNGLDEYPYDLAIDSTGNAYIAGSFMGMVDFDPGPGVDNATSTGNFSTDAFVLKLNTAGQYVWVRHFGGGGSADEARGIALDSQQNIYLTGNFSGSADMDPTSGVVTLSNTFATNQFISKWNAQGNLIWTRGLLTNTMTSGIYPRGIVVDDHGDVITTGFFLNDVDADPGPGTVWLNSNNGTSDIFISRLDAQGNYVWSGQIGGSSWAIYGDQAQSIDIDSESNYVITGHFEQTADFDPGSGTHILPHGGTFVCKFDSNDQFQWANRMGSIWGGSDSWGYEVMAHQNYIYTVGDFSATVDFDIGPDSFLISSNGITDIFVQRLEQCVQSPINLSVQTCSSYTSPSGNNTWHTSGQYLDTVISTAGCSTIYSVALQVHPSYVTPIQVTSCDTYISPSGSYQWNQSGTYSDTLTSQYGCDSILGIQLTVYPSHAINVQEQSCGNYTSPSGNHLWTTSGIYSDTLTAVNGCDSILSINLTVHAPASAQLQDTACRSYVSPSGLYTWTQSGSYSDTLTTIHGCDSIVQLALHIPPRPDTSVTRFTDTLMAAQGYAYQWFQCSGGFLPLSGETNRVFSGTPGQYAVEVNDGTCRDTSQCFEITATPLSLHTTTGESEISCYPNPVQNGSLTVDLGKQASYATLRLLDMHGRVVHEQHTRNQQRARVNIGGSKPNGFYLLEVTLDQGTPTYLQVVIHK